MDDITTRTWHETPPPPGGEEAGGTGLVSFFVSCFLFRSFSSGRTQLKSCPVEESRYLPSNHTPSLHLITPPRPVFPFSALWTASSVGSWFRAVPSNP